MSQLIKITDDGTYQVIDHADVPLSLETLQGHVAGFIERVATAEFDMWMNEEGALRDDFAINVGASRLLAQFGAPGFMIVGPVLLARAADEDSFPLMPETVDRLRAVIEGLGCREQAR